MKKLTVREARQLIGRLEDILEKEGELTITRRGKPIARVVRVVKQRPLPSHRDLRQSMPPMGEGSEKLVRRDRDAR